MSNPHEIIHAGSRTALTDTQRLNDGISQSHYNKPHEKLQDKQNPSARQFKLQCEKRLQKTIPFDIIIKLAEA
ncbi:MAG TPA: hypothetical protein H9676_03265 [Firmicutes bacterium]|nr:hypothetical protein [Bacillota bacterium]